MMKDRKMNDLTITKLADLLGVNRVTVYRKIKSGQIKAFMVANTYIIDDEEVLQVLNGKLSNDEKKKIENIVEIVNEQYSETLRLLGSD